MRINSFHSLRSISQRPLETWISSMEENNRIQLWKENTFAESPWIWISARISIQTTGARLEVKLFRPHLMAASSLFSFTGSRQLLELLKRCTLRSLSKGIRHHSQRTVWVDPLMHKVMVWVPSHIRWLSLIRVKMEVQGQQIQCRWNREVW